MSSPLAIGHFIGTSSVCVESKPQTPITAYTPDKATLSMHDGFSFAQTCKSFSSVVWLLTLHVIKFGSLTPVSQKELDLDRDLTDQFIVPGKFTHSLASKVGISTISPLRLTVRRYDGLLFRIPCLLSVNEMASRYYIFHWCTNVNWEPKPHVKLHQMCTANACSCYRPEDKPPPTSFSRSEYSIYFYFLPAAIVTLTHQLQPTTPLFSYLLFAGIWLAGGTLTQVIQYI